MAQNLKAAMAMEKVYRKLQNKWQAKTAFGYHDKLKQFGFADTVEYERAKDEYHLKNADFQILEITAPQFIPELQKAIAEGKETVFFVHPEKLMAWIGSDPFNEAYCKENDIPTFLVRYAGGTIVTGVEDVAIGLLTRRITTRKHFAEILHEFIKQDIPNAELVDNDILVDGYKVFGIGYKSFGDLHLATYQVTVKAYPEAIRNICLKEMKKEPKGLTDFGVFDKTEFLNKVRLWLR